MKTPSQQDNVLKMITCTYLCTVSFICLLAFNTIVDVSIFLFWVVQVKFVTYLPDKYADIILGTSKCRHRRDACSHGYFAVHLNKPWAEEVIATCGLICIALKTPFIVIRTMIWNWKNKTQRFDDNIFITEANQSYSPVSEESCVVIAIQIWTDLLS